MLEEQPLPLAEAALDGSTGTLLLLSEGEGEEERLPVAMELPEWRGEPVVLPL